MIEDDKLNAVEIAEFVHRLGQFQDKLAVLGLELVRRDLDGLLGARLAMAAAGEHFPDAARPQEVGDVSVTAAVPGEQQRTGVALAVDLVNAVDAFGEQVELGLPAVVRPAQTQHFSLGVAAETER